MVVEGLVQALPAGARERLVYGNLRQPGREFRSTVELAKMRIRIDVCLLHDILGLVIVADDRAGRAIHALVVPPHQDLEERGLALEDTRDDLFIGNGAEFGYHSQLGRHLDSSPVQSNNSAKGDK